MHLYLDAAPNTGYLRSIRSHAAILKILEESGYKYFFDLEKEAYFKLSKDSVGILIKQALGKNLASVHIGNRRSTVEQFNDSVARLKTAYGLKEASVAMPSAEESGGNPPPLGKQAAALFADLIQRHGATPTVGIGGGRTMREMAFWLNPPQVQLTVCATNYATRIPDSEVYDSSYLAMNVHWLCSKSQAKILSLPPLPSGDPALAARWHSNLFRSNPDIVRLFEESLDADIIFVGTGNFDRLSPSISRVFSHLGISFETLSTMEPHPVGDINLCFFDRTGKDITPQILMENLKGKIPPKELAAGTFFKSHPFCHAFLVGMNIDCLKDLVSRDKTVVLVAGGQGTKTDAIHTLLRAKIVNGLVTDAITMENLLKPYRLSGDGV